MVVEGVVCLVCACRLANRLCHSNLGVSKILLTPSPELLRPRRLTGGTQASGCDYPGVVAISFSGKVLCNGIYRTGSVTVPDYCTEFMNFVNQIE